MKLNQILAAALVAAASVPAMASISPPLDGNGELFLVVWDQVNQVSYTKDLGIFMNDFNGIADLSFSLNDANFTGFLGIANMTASDIKYAVMAGDGAGSNTANPRRLFSTIDSATTPLSNGQLTGTAGYLNDYTNFQVTESAHTTHAGNTSVNGTSYDTNGKLAYFLERNGPTLNGILAPSNWTNSNLVGTSSVFRTFTTSSTAAGVQSVKSDFLGQWNVTQNNGAWTAAYNVAAIPEADGIVMALAGFGALGFLSLRRRQD